MAQGLRHSFDLSEYPHFVKMMEHALQPGYDYLDEFEHGLDVILDGLERMSAPVGVSPSNRTNAVGPEWPGA